MPILTFFIGRWVDAVFEFQPYPPFPLNLFIGFFFLLLGFNVGIKSTKLLYKRGKGLPWGEVVEEVQTSKLVNFSIYKYVRNPMVLSYSLLPFGMGVIFSSPGMALSISPFVFILNIIIVRFMEEPSLEKRFGEEYISYKKATPFLVPNALKLVKEVVAPRIQKKSAQLTYLTLSLGGLLILTKVVFSEPPNVGSSSFFTGIAFTLICMIGVTVAIAPNFFRLDHGGGNSPKQVNSGHHPNCYRFSNHVLRFLGRTLCAGCSGLAVGGIIAIIGNALYFVYSWLPLEKEIMFWTGVLMVSLGLIQHFIDLGNPFIHMALNVVLVTGSYLIVISVMKIGVSTFVQRYTLALTLFWVITRIRISQWEHLDVCRDCDEPCTIGYFE